MIKSTRNNLKKLEALFEELEYVVRYEKGNFQSGYCIFENKRIAVINKFYDVEGRINCLLDILSTLDVDPNLLSESALKVYKLASKVINKKASADKTSAPSDSE